MRTERKYDAIVVGAGIGGLSAASILAKRGKKVLVIDEAPISGGASTQFRKDAFTFTRGPLLFGGFGRNGVFHQLFFELGIPLGLIKGEGKIIRRLDPQLQIILPEHRIDIPIDEKELFEEFQREFPGQLQVITGFYKKIEEINRHTRHHSPSYIKRDRVSLFERIKALVIYWTNLYKKGSDYLKTLGIGEELNRIINLQTAFFSHATTDQLNVVVLANLLKAIRDELFYVKGGIPTLSQEIVRSFIKMGGQVLYSTKVSEILFEEGRPKGIRLEEDKTIEADQFIFNLPIPRKADSLGVLSLYIASDADVIPPSMGEHLLVFCDYLGPFGMGDLIYISCPKDKELSPEGRRPITLSSYLRGSLTEESKAELRAKMMKNLTWLIPFSEGHIDLLHEEYSLDTEEARFRSIKGQMASFKNLRQREIGRASYYKPFKNMFIIDDSGLPFSGMGGEVKAGIIVAELLSRR